MTSQPLPHPYLMVERARPYHRNMNTEQVVAILRAAGLQAETRTRRNYRPGFRVHQFSRSVVGLDGASMTDAEWAIAMSALVAAGLIFPYRSDQGRGCQIARAS